MDQPARETSSLSTPESNRAAETSRESERGDTNEKTTILRSKHRHESMRREEDLQT